MKTSKILKVKPLGHTWETLDPFIFSVHHYDKFPEGDEQMRPKTGIAGRNIGQDFSNKDGWNMYHGQQIPGFPIHPHRGFETITIVEQGVADHSDSLGSTGRFGGGDVQWMTAGQGVQHSEMFPLVHKNKPNTLELFQIWLNLPKKNKMVKPNYQMLWSEAIPTQKIKDANGIESTVKIIAGEFNEVNSLPPPPNSWAAQKENQLAVWLLNIPANGVFELPKAAKEINRVLYIYSGNGVSVDGELVENYHSVQVDSSYEIKIRANTKNSRILLLQAKPISEPVVQYGPFVMNTEQEIREAYKDFQQTQFGSWPWKTEEPVHEAATGRFAKYANGTIEKPQK